MFHLERSLASLALVLSISVNCYPYYSTCGSSYYSNRVDTTVLNTLNGKVKGECYNVAVSYPDNSVRNSEVFTWLSVPYAEPPVNDKRFAKPEPVRSWNTTKDGKQWPKKCIQLPYHLRNSWQNLNLQQLNQMNISDDCLYLNIFVPANNYMRAVVNQNLFSSFSRLPILVFIHGGSLIEGSSTDDAYEPSTLAATNNVIVVTINYRLDAYGFMYLSGSKAVGNQGILDQSLALKWVYDNAHTFGGDRDKITLSGQSAGGYSVGYHLLYKPSWPYFRNAIILSGSILLKNFPFISPEEASNRTVSILSSLGCQSSRNPDDLINCAQRIDPALFLVYSKRYFLSLFNGNTLAYSLHFSQFPIVQDGIAFQKSIKELFDQNEFKQCNILIGHTSEEAGNLLPTNDFGSTREQLSQAFLDRNTFSYLINRTYEYFPSYPNKSSRSFIENIIQQYGPPSGTNQTSFNYFSSIINAISQQVFVCPTIDLSNYYSKSQNVYLYSYEYRLSSSYLPPNFGVVHADDLITFFVEPLAIKTTPLISPNPSSSTRNNYTRAEKEISLEHMKYFTNFVKYNNPNGYLILNRPQKNWPSYKYQSRFSILTYFYNIFKRNTNKPVYMAITNSNGFIVKEDFSKYKCNVWS